jgi:magnesium transporter
MVRLITGCGHPDGPLTADFLQSMVTKPDVILWLDVTAAETSDWETLSRAFGFHPLALEDAKKQNQRPKVDQYPDHLFMSIPTVDAGCEPGALETIELDIFLGANYIVTISDKPLPVIQELAEQCKRTGQTSPSSAGILYTLLDTIVDDYFPAMDTLDTAIDILETRAFSSGDPVPISETVKIKRDLIVLRRALAPMRDVINHILRISDTHLIPHALMPYFHDVYDHTLRLVETIDLHRDLLTGVVDIILAQTSNQLNQVMKTMTAISTILMGCALIAGIYGMNFKHMPELDWKLGYVFCLGLMLSSTAGLVWYFKRLRWL